MIWFSLAALALSASGGGNVVMYDFYGDYCPPCRAMSPVVERLKQMGYPLRKIDVGRNRMLARRYRVSSIPCFVLVSNGKEVGRVVGAVPGSRLQAMFHQIGFRPGAASSPKDFAAPSLVADPARRQGQTPRLGSPSLLASVPANATSPNATSTGAVPNEYVKLADHSEPTPRIQPIATPNNQAEQAPLDVAETPLARALAASARIKIEDPDGFSWGSGTIIDSREREALILTCGHIFRDSQGKGKIVVDLFGPAAPKQLPGRLIAYDLRRDVGLVQVTTPYRLVSVPVAPSDRQPSQG
ncbi:MAG: thioredoxin domain-containing protein, partial [Planctomycetales bacterium]